MTEFKKIRLHGHGHAGAQGAPRRALDLGTPFLHPPPSLHRRTWTTWPWSRPSRPPSPTPAATATTCRASRVGCGCSRPTGESVRAGHLVTLSHCLARAMSPLARGAASTGEYMWQLMVEGRPTHFTNGTIDEATPRTTWELSDMDIAMATFRDWDWRTYPGYFPRGKGRAYLLALRLSVPEPRFTRLAGRGQTARLRSRPAPPPAICSNG